MDSVQDLCSLLTETYRALIDAGRPVALVDFPDAMNSGDHAIWLGEKALLKALGIEPAYQCAVENYDREAMRKAIGDDGTILMHGGGNFGDIYRLYHEFRLLVLQDFPANPVVVFPQTMMFFSDAELQRTVRHYGAHGNVTLSARDALTFHTMKKHFGDSCRVVLAPDMAMMLGPLSRSGVPSFDFSWISRADGEYRHNHNDIEAIKKAFNLQQMSADLGKFDDGIPTSATALSDGKRIIVSDWYSLIVAGDSGTDVEKLREGYKLDMDERAQFWVGRAMRLLSAGRVVISDRLHAHLLCMLAGIPHVLMNNTYGKNLNYFETWSRPTELCRFANSPVHAVELAQETLLANAAQWHRTDLKRWSEPDNLHDSWNIRSERAAAFVRPGATLLDIGCGKMAIEKLLPENCRYIPMDVVARDERTIVGDLNAGEYPDASGADHVSVLGVIEYLNQPAAFWAWIAQYKSRLILSYIVSAPEFPMVKRRAMGWVNDFGRDDIVAQAGQAGFVLTHEEAIPPDNTLFVFDRRDAAKA